MQSKPRDFFAIIPAAGHSRRMGKQHKLLLSWGDNTVMSTVIRNWRNSDATKLLVVVRADDLELQAECERTGRCELIIPGMNPADMKESIQIAVRHIEEHHRPTDLDRCLIAPADLPTLTGAVINHVVEVSRTSESMVAPLFGDRTGHPICIPWSHTHRLFELGEGQGVNHLITSGPVEMFSLPQELRPDDIDTPEEYRRLLLASRDPDAGPLQI